MKITKEQKTVTYYVCENCGAKHKKQDDIFSSEMNGKEICNKCFQKVQLYNPRTDDLETYFVGKNEVTEGYESWEAEYVYAVESERDKFFKALTDINKKYLANDEDYFREFMRF